MRSLFSLILAARAAVLLAVLLVPTAAAAQATPVGPGSPADVLPWAVGQTRGGIPVVAIGAPGSPWAVVQLHGRIDLGDMPPDERRSLTAMAEALADGALAGRPRPIGQDVTDAGGTSRARVDADTFVIADGAPMERLDALLRALDERLRGRARLQPATRRVEIEPTADPAIPADALALAAPGDPIALPTTGGSTEPAALRAVADRALRRDRLAIAVVGPLPASELLGLVLRRVGAPVPAAPARPTAPPADVNGQAGLVEGTRLAEVPGAEAVGQPAGAVAKLWLVGAGRGSPGASPADRAARSVLARLVGGKSAGTGRLFAIALDVESPRSGAIARAEGARLRQLVDVAATPPPDDVVVAARAQERAARLERLKNPNAVADALGRALLAGDAGLLEKELAALLEVTPAAVAAAAAAAAAGPRVVVRSVPGVAGGSVGGLAAGSAP